MSLLIASYRAALFLCTLMLAIISHADQNFHTERLPLWDADENDDHPPLRAGHVIDIHTEGPVNEAIERYFINGAKPNTDYQVVLVVDGVPGFPLCTGAFLPFFIGIPTDVLSTNKHGQARGGIEFPTGSTGEGPFGVLWQLVPTDALGPPPVPIPDWVGYSQDDVAYQTDCIIVTTD